MMPRIEELEEQFRKELNEEQQNAVFYPLETPLQVLAGPGTGKTKALSSRVAYLIAKGIRPADIIVTTFTRKAALEMKLRVTMILNDTDGSSMRFLKIGTFHSICFLYLLKYGNRIGLSGKPVIAGETDKADLLEKILGSDAFEITAKNMKFKKEKKNYFKRTDSDTETVEIVSVKSVGYELSRAKSFGVPVEQYVQTCPNRLCSIAMEQYQKELYQQNLLDFDDILLRCKELLTKHPHLVDGIQAVLVDEFQDNNYVQMEIANLFAQKTGHITVVGDPDQSIYAFRHAQVLNFRRMLDIHPETGVVYLERNYRSVQPILDSALNLIRQDHERFGADRNLKSQVHSESPHTNLKSSPTIVEFQSARIEAEAIAQHISQLKNDSGAQFFYRDFAILARYSSSMSRVEMALTRWGIPYRLSGGFSFWKRAEIKVVIDYLRVVYHGNDELAIVRALSTPKRGIGKVSMDKLRQRFEGSADFYAELKSLIEDGEACKQFKLDRVKASLQEFVQLIDEARARLTVSSTPNSLAKVTDFILDKSGLKELYSTNPSKIKNISFLNQYIRGLDQTLKQDTNMGTLRGEEGNIDYLHQLLSNSSLNYSENEESSSDEKREGKVCISTIHSAKGLEWNVVFVVNCKDEHQLSGFDTEEERRIYFVAMTRAAAILYLTFAEENPDYGPPSRLTQFFANSNFLTLCNYEVGAFKDLKFSRLQELMSILKRDPPIEGGKDPRRVSKSILNRPNGQFSRPSVDLVPLAGYRVTKEMNGKGHHKPPRTLSCSPFGRRSPFDSSHKASVKTETSGTQSLALPSSPLHSQSLLKYTHRPFFKNETSETKSLAPFYTPHRDQGKVKTLGVRRR